MENVKDGGMKGRREEREEDRGLNMKDSTVNPVESGGRVLYGRRIIAVNGVD